MTEYDLAVTVSVASLTSVTDEHEGQSLLDIEIIENMYVERILVPTAEVAVAVGTPLAILNDECATTQIEGGPSLDLEVCFDTT